MTIRWLLFYPKGGGGSGGGVGSHWKALNLLKDGLKESTSVPIQVYKSLACWIWRRQWQPTPVLLPGKSHGWRSLVGCSPWGPEELDTTERLHFHFSLSCIGEGNGNPFQCSCLENPRDGGAWWAAVCGVPQSQTHGVAQSQIRLKWLSSSSSSSSLLNKDKVIWSKGNLSGDIKMLNFFGGGVGDRERINSSWILFYPNIERVNKETNGVFKYHLKCF